jgi:hypothetical protein
VIGGGQERKDVKENKREVSGRQGEGGGDKH